MTRIPVEHEIYRLIGTWLLPKSHVGGTRTTRGGVAELSSAGRLVGLIRLWHATNGRLLRSLTGHTNTVYSLTVSTEGKQLASGSFDRSAKVWVLSTGKRLTRCQ